MIPRLHNQRTMSMNCAFSTIMCTLDVNVMDVMAILWKYYSNSCKMMTSEDVSNQFVVTGRKTLVIDDIVEENMYFTIIFFSQHFTHLHTCQKYHPYTPKQTSQMKNYYHKL